jgi:hypothetical protein
LLTLDLKPAGAEGERSVVVTVPARLLADGYYQIQLTGRSPDGTPKEIYNYYFRVTHQ